MAIVISKHIMGVHIAMADAKAMQVPAAWENHVCQHLLIEVHISWSVVHACGKLHWWHMDSDCPYPNQCASRN